MRELFKGGEISSLWGYKQHPPIVRVTGRVFDLRAKNVPILERWAGSGQSMYKAFRLDPVYIDRVKKSVAK